MDYVEMEAYLVGATEDEARETEPFLHYRDANIASMPADYDDEPKNIYTVTLRVMLDTVRLTD